MTDAWNERSRTLPAGLTCDHCAGIARCARLLDRKPEGTVCLWDPGRFRVKVELHQEAVAGLAAYRETMGALLDQIDYVTVKRALCIEEDHPVRVAAATLLASPDPGQAILARLKLGQAVADAERARRKAMDRWAPMSFDDPGEFEGWQAVNAGQKALYDAVAALVKAVSPDA